MKKIIASSIIASALIAVPTFANEVKMEIMPISDPIYVNSEIIEDTATNKYETIIRNNKIEADGEYNNSHYYTTKIKTQNIVIPEELKDSAEKFYFLVEEGSPRYYFGSMKMQADSMEISEVTEEYNYKIVDFDASKKEYIFNNEDLVKDFDEDTNKSVSITLIAELKDGKQVVLSNGSYINISSKENILSNLVSQENETSYYGYYNSSELENYLETMSEKMKRSEYKTMLSKADSKISRALRENTKNKDEMLEKITREAHFSNHISDYKSYSEVNKLMNGLNSAVKNQLQNIRAFDAIDKILK